MHRGSYQRKTVPKIKGGKVQKKNDHRLTPWRGFVVDRETPRQGFRHLVTKRDIFDFIELLPDWRDLVYGLEHILLSRGHDDEEEDSTEALYTHYESEGTGGIEIAAWKNDLIQDIPADYFAEHRSIFQKIGLKHEIKGDSVTCWFDEPKARAFILVHVFVHELGHHHDRMSGKSPRSSRGESYAENFANRLEDIVWPKYVEKFGKP